MFISVQGRLKGLSRYRHGVLLVQIVYNNECIKILDRARLSEVKAGMQAWESDVTRSLRDMNGIPEERPTFSWFKSEICHQVKNKGDLHFIRELLETDTIREYFNREWHLESLYLLAMLDYLSKENGLPWCTRYNDLRYLKFPEPIFPLSVLMATDLTHDNTLKEISIRDAIPEFLRHNIIEGAIRDVV